MTARSSKSSDLTPADVRLEPVLPQIDRSRRIAAMLARWEEETPELGDEPEWQLDDVAALSLRTSGG